MKKFETLKEFENFYDLMMPAQEKSDEAFVWFSGIPHPLFNAVMHCKKQGDRIEKFTSMNSKNIPVSFWVHDQNGGEEAKTLLKNHGFLSLINCTLMTWDVHLLELKESKIQKACPETFHSILAKVFQFEEEVKNGFAALLQNVGAENYVIYDKNGIPIGTGSLISHQNLGGIFNISVLPEYQKQGFGRSMVQFLMHRASHLKLKKLILLSSYEAKKLYTDAGFSEVLNIEIYTKFP